MILRAKKQNKIAKIIMSENSYQLQFCIFTIVSSQPKPVMIVVISNFFFRNGFQLIKIYILKGVVTF